MTRVLIPTVALFGVAALFAMSEPASASTQQPVMSDDVRMVSEQMQTHSGLAVGKNGWGPRGRGLGGGRLCR